AEPLSSMRRVPLLILSVPLLLKLVRLGKMSRHYSSLLFCFDLGLLLNVPAKLQQLTIDHTPSTPMSKVPLLSITAAEPLVTEMAPVPVMDTARSEERRVGKECGVRWGAERCKVVGERNRVVSRE